MGRIVTFAFVILLGSSPVVFAAPPPAVTTAADGILNAFRTHPLVGLGDSHELAQEEDFYAALIRDPRFARDVGNIIVEFGDASWQGTIDRYLNGDNVPYEELRKVWSDGIGPNLTFKRIGYMNFFAQVRNVNLVLPPAERIHVYLGDPPIDWSKIQNSKDWVPFVRKRDNYPAEVIDREILSKGKKALVIYGTLHFYPADGPITEQLRGLVEQKYPNAFFVITPYDGFNQNACNAQFEHWASEWPTPALITPVRNTTLEIELRRPGCDFTPPGQATFQPNLTEDEKAKAAATLEDEWSGVAGDAILFMGPSAKLTLSPLDPGVYLDSAYRQEIERRYKIVFGQPLKVGPADASPVAARQFNR